MKLFRGVKFAESVVAGGLFVLIGALLTQEGGEVTRWAGVVVLAAGLLVLIACAWVFGAAVRRGRKGGGG